MFRLLLANDWISFINFLFALLKFFFHFYNLSLINSVCVCQLNNLFLKGGDQGLRLLDKLLFVSNLSLERLV
jgi:hypothetical protein